MQLVLLHVTWCSCKQPELLCAMQWYIATVFSPSSSVTTIVTIFCCTVALPERRLNTTPIVCSLWDMAVLSRRVMLTQPRSMSAVSVRFWLVQINMLVAVCICVCVCVCVCVWACMCIVYRCMCDVCVCDVCVMCMLTRWRRWKRGRSGVFW